MSTCAASPSVHAILWWPGMSHSIPGTRLGALVCFTCTGHACTRLSVLVSVPRTEHHQHASFEPMIDHPPSCTIIPLHGTRSCSHNGNHARKHHSCVAEGSLQGMCSFLTGWALACRTCMLSTCTRICGHTRVCVQCASGSRAALGLTEDVFARANTHPPPPYIRTHAHMHTHARTQHARKYDTRRHILAFLPMLSSA